MNIWYHNTRPDSVQGIVIEEGTGRTVAVAYDPRDTALLAAAPAMLKELKRMLALLDDSGGYDEAAHELEAFINTIK